ncbi:MAG: deoxyguanosinetriphosphate triphosphohydrolase [Acidobacteriota bacterium]
MPAHASDPWCGARLSPGRTRTQRAKDPSASRSNAAGFAESYNADMDLAPYAMRDEESQGRRYPEPPHPYRSEFQRDRDRIIHTRAFRRLEKKTQVFAPDVSDHFRNRLTHTLEVSQISRTVAAALQLNTDLCEVLALSHDIGHPPFSHEGERVLDDIMRRFGRGFDHNLHALRIVEDFEQKYAAFRGLNLTFEVREGIIKHSRDYAAGEGSYLAISEYRLGQRPPLEAQVIDLADEIAYNTADLDDGFEAKLLRVPVMREELPFFDLLWREMTERFPGAEEKLRFNEVLRRLIDGLVTGLIDQTRRNLEAAAVRSVEEVRNWPTRLVGFAPDFLEINRQLKDFLRRRLYEHEVLRRAREDVRRVLEFLFEHYLQHPDALPRSQVARLDSSPLEQVVCDYIAGMTDFFARDKYRELRGELANAVCAPGGV